MKTKINKKILSLLAIISLSFIIGGSVGFLIKKSLEEKSLFPYLNNTLFDINSSEIDVNDISNNKKPLQISQKLEIKKENWHVVLKKSIISILAKNFGILINEILEKEDSTVIKGDNLKYTQNYTSLYLD